MRYSERESQLVMIGLIRLAVSMIQEAAGAKREDNCIREYCCRALERPTNSWVRLSS